MSTLDVFDIFTRDYARERFETMSLRDWLLAARDDKMLYATPAERMVAAIGEAELVDTAQDSRLGRIFFNRTIKTYKAFDGFFGMEDTIERIVSYFKHAAQGLELGEVERQQVAVGQRVVVRQPVKDGVVDGGADVVAERSTPERGRVVDVAGPRSSPDDHGLRPPVDVQEARADRATALQGLQDVGDQGARLSGSGQLGGVQDLDHAAPFSCVQ